MATLQEVQRELARRKVQAVLAERQQEAPAPVQQPSGISGGSTAATVAAGPTLALASRMGPKPTPTEGLDPITAAAEKAAPGYGGRLATRGTFEAAGGTAGTIAGAGAGPAGMLGGSILGSMGGSAAYDAANDLVRWVYGLEQPAQGFERLRETYNNAVGAGAFDAFAAALFPIIGPVAKAIPRFLTRVSPDMAPAIDNARGLGIEPTSKMVGQRASALAQATSRLPFVGTGRDTKRTVAQIQRVVDDYSRRLGADLTFDEAADAIALGGEKRARDVMNGIDAAYGLVRTKAAEKGNKAIFPAQSMARAGHDYLAEAGEVAVPVSGKVDLSAITSAATPEEFLKGVAQLDGVHLTYSQLQRLRTVSGRLIGKTGPTFPGGPYQDELAYRYLKQFRAGTRDAMTDATDQEVATLAQQANQFYSEWKTFIMQPGLAEFRRAVPGVATKHEFSRPSTLETQKLLATYTKEKSPRILNMVRQLVGDEAFGQVRRRAFMDTFLSSTKQVEGGGMGLDTMALRENFGLNSREGELRLEALLKGSDVTTGDVRRLVDALETVGDQFLPEVSQFMTRSLMLRTAGTGAAGGVHGILATTLLAGAGGGGAMAAMGAGGIIPGVIGTLIPLRLFNEALSSRRVLNWMVRGVQEYNAGGQWQHTFRRAMQVMERGERDAHAQEQATAPTVSD